MTLIHSTPACNLPSIMQHGLQARIDALVTWKNNKDADLIRPGVNLWRPLNVWELEHGLKHWNDDPHVVLVIDWTRLQHELLKHQRAAWWRYFADIPISAISVSERQLKTK
jgi:hypothetical protein